MIFIRRHLRPTCRPSGRRLNVFFAQAYLLAGIQFHESTTWAIRPVGGQERPCRRVMELSPKLGSVLFRLK